MLIKIHKKNLGKRPVREVVFTESEVKFCTIKNLSKYTQYIAYQLSKSLMMIIKQKQHQQIIAEQFYVFPLLFHNAADNF